MLCGAPASPACRGVQVKNQVETRDGMIVVLMAAIGMFVIDIVTHTGED